MTTEERIVDIMSTELFNEEELESRQNDSSLHCFASWEYYQIFHATNEELYYLDYSDPIIQEADETYDTELGRIFCFK